MIVDFIGIFDNLQRALAFDSTDIDGIYENIDALRDEFKKLIERGQNDYLSIFTNIPDDQQIAKYLIIIDTQRNVSVIMNFLSL